MFTLLMTNAGIEDQNTGVGRRLTLQIGGASAISAAAGFFF
jgi:hypothetical protein